MIVEQLDVEALNDKFEEMLVIRKIRVLESVLLCIQ